MCGAECAVSTCALPHCFIVLILPNHSMCPLAVWKRRGGGGRRLRLRIRHCKNSMRRCFLLPVQDSAALRVLVQDQHVITEQRAEIERLKALLKHFSQALPSSVGCTVPTSPCTGGARTR